MALFIPINFFISTKVFRNGHAPTIGAILEEEKCIERLRLATSRKHVTKHVRAENNGKYSGSYTVVTSPAAVIFGYFNFLGAYLLQAAYSVTKQGRTFRCIAS